MLLLWGIFLVGVAVSEGALCSSDAVEGRCDSGGITKLNVTKRLMELEDLSWLLTPRSYLLTHGNHLTFSSIYETLFGICATQADRLENMRAGLDFDMRNLILFAEPNWMNESNLHSPFLHLICEPSADANLWASLYQSIFSLPNRNTSSIEEVLRGKVDANIIQKFGKFTCKPNPSCKSPSPDNKLCSPGVRMENFEKWELALTWTDHLSGASETGSSLLLEGCLGGSRSWALWSLVPTQSHKNVKEVRAQLAKDKFSPERYTWGNFNSWY